MRSWIEFLAAAGVCGTVALTSAASFGQAAYTEGPPPGVGGPTYYYPYGGGYSPEVWWQYRGGPKSTSTTDLYYVNPGFEVYSFEGPNYGRAVGPR